MLFAFALLCEAKQNAAEGKAPSVRIDTDGLTVTIFVNHVSEQIRERYKEPPDAQSRLVRGFAIDRCGGKIDVNETDDGAQLQVTLKAKI